MKRFYKMTAVFLAACLLTAFISFIPANAAPVAISDTVSLLTVKTNQGDLSKYGYQWDNINAILTLKDLNIETENDYGLKIPDGATVVLMGDNTIKASKAALYLGGALSASGITFKGKGSLTLISENGSGILDNSSDKNAIFRITSGSISIECGGDGISSKNAQIALVGGKISINSSGSNSYAINGRSVTVNGGCRLSANAPITSSELSVSSAYLDISSDKPALQADFLEILRVKISAGASSDSLSETDTYNGEHVIKTQTNFFLRTQSIIFGEKYTITADILLLCALIAVLAVIIIIPVILKKRKVKRILEIQDAAEKARIAEIKAKKNEARKKYSKTGNTDQK